MVGTFLLCFSNQSMAIFSEVTVNALGGGNAMYHLHASCTWLFVTLFSPELLPFFIFCHFGKLTEIVWRESQMKRL